MSDYDPSSYIVSSRYNLLREQLSKHPLYTAIHDVETLRVFMEHHVYAVWDFMSLIKSLQRHIAPTRIPWIPPQNSRYANFINQLVLEEESDYALTDKGGSTHASHFESYCHAMAEIGANVTPIKRFIDMVKNDGLDKALKTADIPAPAKRFMTFTFDTIDYDRSHLVAAVLAYGRESLVPDLFRCIQEGLQIGSCEAPILHAYLERHIQLDECEHGPLAVKLMEELCENSCVKHDEAVIIAEQALTARVDLWDGIHEALLS